MITAPWPSPQNHSSRRVLLTHLQWSLNRNLRSLSFCAMPQKKVAAAVLHETARWHCDTGGALLLLFCLMWTFVVSGLSQVLKLTHFSPSYTPGPLFEFKCLCDIEQTECFWWLTQFLTPCKQNAWICHFTKFSLWFQCITKKNKTEPFGKYDPFSRQLRKRSRF